MTPSSACSDRSASAVYSKSALAQIAPDLFEFLLIVLMSFDIQLIELFGLQTLQSLLTSLANECGSALGDNAGCRIDLG
jgi:hypothetical protein